MKRKVSILLIVIGLFLILLPTVADMILKIISDNNADNLDQLTAEDLQRNMLRDADFDFNGVRDVDLTRTLIGSRNFDPNLIIGQIIIEDINLNLPIVKGVSESNLLAGAATMKKDQIMGKNNYTLAGHYIKRKDTLFGGLMDIKKGSIIKITDKKIVYEYSVYNTAVVSDTNLAMISDNKSNQRGTPIISLMTCYYSSKTGKRFFALGELVKEYPYDDTFNKVKLYSVGVSSSPTEY
ncbi:sortase [Alkalibaculum sp. M08DMB]|uniref:Sortase n=1 Tax=Alkalibaculum sporogenes TaxID=2655001 RepID=A0A6A7K5G0_9FIRM|nr:class A sortase [Alkalibaculum sporogenes]MPW24658.1 sortase [Alkalibaculum sporogenes]